MSILLHLALILLFSNLFSQEIPIEFLEKKIKKDQLDFGIDWDSNTSLGSIRFYQINKSIYNTRNPDSLYINFRFGVNKNLDVTSIYGFGHFNFKKYLYGYLYPRIVNNPNALIRYSGIPRDIARGGFNSGETDMSGIGFENEWLAFQFGRGREVWGAGKDIQLVLNEFSPSYDYAMLSSKYNNINVKYIHGFLESNSDNINRYIVGKGIEWSNKKSIILSLAEIIIYSGENRPLDIGYLNPISSHLEIELNDRLNTISSSDANAVWQISFDSYIKENLRLSFNFLYDEFIFDKIEKEKGKENGKAYSFRISKLLVMNSYNRVNLFISNINIGTPTFRHGNGYNNFVNRNKPLGWRYGSDTKERFFGFNHTFKEKYFSTFITGNREIGEESILYRPYERYEDYLKGSFPSGSTLKLTYFRFESSFWIKKNLLTLLSLNMERDFSGVNKIDFNVGFDYHFSKNLVI